MSFYGRRIAVDAIIDSPTRKSIENALTGGSAVIDGSNFKNDIKRQKVGKTS